MRTCACGCGRDLQASRRRTAIYYDERCRQRAYRKRVRDAAEAAGVSASLSLKSLDASSGAPSRNGDAKKGATRAERPKRGPRAGVTVYLPTPLLADRVREVLGQAASEGQGDLQAAVDAVAKAMAREARRRAPARTGRFR